MKTEKMRGQAHIVFKDVQASTQAIRALQGFEFFGKPMVRCSLFHSILGVLKLITDVDRKSFMPREHPTLSPDFVELTIYQYPLPARLLMCRRIFRSRFLVGLRGQRRCRQTPPVSPMAQLKVLKDLAKKKAMEKRQWTRIVMYRWKLHQMRINIIILKEIWRYSDKDDLQRQSVPPSYFIC